MFIEIRQKGHIRRDVVEEGGKKMKEAFAVLEEEFLRDTAFCSIPSTHVSIGMLTQVSDCLLFWRHGALQEFCPVWRTFSSFVNWSVCVSCGIPLMWTKD